MSISHGGILARVGEARSTSTEFVRAHAEWSALTLEDATLAEQLFARAQGALGEVLEGVPIGVATLVHGMLWTAFLEARDLQLRAAAAKVEASGPP